MFMLINIYWDRVCVQFVKRTQYAAVLITFHVGWQLGVFYSVPAQLCQVPDPGAHLRHGARRRHHHLSARGGARGAENLAQGQQALGPVHQRK